MKRKWLIALFLTMSAVCTAGCGRAGKTGETDAVEEHEDADGWDMADVIVKKLQDNEPEFADYSVDVEEFGGIYLQEALTDNETDKAEEARIAKANTEALRQAFEKVSVYEKDGKKGGRVIIHDGYFYTGAIHMESNVNLHLDDGANVMFTTDYSQYPNVLTRWEGIICYNYSPLISQLPEMVFLMGRLRRINTGFPGKTVL